MPHCMDKGACHLVFTRSTSQGGGQPSLSRFVHPTARSSPPGRFGVDLESGLEGRVTEPERPSASSYVRSSGTIRTVSWDPLPASEAIRPDPVLLILLARPGPPQESALQDRSECPCALGSEAHGRLEPKRGAIPAVLTREEPVGDRQVEVRVGIQARRPHLGPTDFEENLGGGSGRAIVAPPASMGLNHPRRGSQRCS